MNIFDQHKTAAMTKFLAKEKGHRVVGLTIEQDGVFIYTNTVEWHDGGLAGTFRGDSETAAIKAFYRNVTKTTDEERAYLERA